jgi:hypothetical protein
VGLLITFRSRLIVGITPIVTGGGTDPDGEVLSNEEDEMLTTNEDELLLTINEI